jgi:hypothetical protein
MAKATITMSEDGSNVVMTNLALDPPCAGNPLALSDEEFDSLPVVHKAAILLFGQFASDLMDIAEKRLEPDSVSVRHAPIH